MLELVHSNRLDSLAEHLMVQLGREKTDPFLRQTIIVQNAGSKRWLQQYLSHRNGIAAQLDFPLPSRFIRDLLLKTVTSEQQIQALDAEQLRWKLFEYLEQNSAESRLQAIAEVIEQDSTGLRRFILAQQLAGLFDQYQVYRPALVKHWADPQQALQEQDWQGWLWRGLLQSSSEQHRAALLESLLQTLHATQIDAGQLPEHLWVFAVSSLSPVFVQVLAALGDLIDVTVLILNPCQHYWGDIQSRREQLGKGMPAVDDNELLASLGREARDHIDLWYVQNSAFQDLHLFHPITGNTLLHSIQRDIFDLQQTTFSVSEQDTSLRIVCCYSPLREVERLKDELLGLFDTDMDLKPSDIAVMCQDVAQTLPLIETVFNSGEHTIPVHTGLHRSLLQQPLIQALLDWLRLPISRLTVTEVLGWLQLPALRRRFEIHEEDLPVIEYWIQSQSIHWGFDVAHKQSLAESNSAAGSWLNAIENLYSGWMMGEGVRLLGPQRVSHECINDREWQLLGQLICLLEILKNTQQVFSTPKKLLQWQQQINRLIDSLLLTDEQENQMLQQFRDALSELVLQQQRSGCVTAVGYEVLLQALENRFREQPAQGVILNGGINVGSLLNLYHLPFKVVCLLSMGDEQFPKRQNYVDFDLIARNPQRGDPVSRDHDRYHFLQALLSAREKLYISYVGRDMLDDAEKQPSTVVSELMDYVKTVKNHTLAVESVSLHPFSEETFRRGSYAKHWHPLKSENTLSLFYSEVVASTQATATQQSDDSLEIDQLLRFFRNPVAAWIKNHLNLLLPIDAKLPEDDEVFEIDALQRYQLLHLMLDSDLCDANLDKNYWKTLGYLPEGVAGEQLLEDYLEHVQTAVGVLRKEAFFTGFTPLRIKYKANKIHLQGTIDSWSDQLLLNLQLSRNTPARQLQLWITHCLQNAAGLARATKAVYLPVNRKFETTRFKEIPVTKAQNMIQGILELYQSGLGKPVPFFPNTAYAYVKKLAEESEQSARVFALNQWYQHNLYSVNEREDPYVSLYFKNTDIDGLPEEFFQLSRTLLQPMFDYQEKDRDS